MTSSIKLEVYNVSQRRQRRGTEPQPRATCTKNLAKFGRAVFELWERTDTETDRQTDILIAIWYTWTDRVEAGLNDAWHSFNAWQMILYNTPYSLNISLITAAQNVSAIWVTLCFTVPPHVSTIRVTPRPTMPCHLIHTSHVATTKSRRLSLLALLYCKRPGNHKRLEWEGQVCCWIKFKSMLLKAKGQKRPFMSQ